MSSPILLIGIGNEYRCDDSIGLHVIRALEERKLPDTVLVESSGDGAELIETFSSVRMAILIDAVSSGGNPGAIYRFIVYAIEGENFSTGIGLSSKVEQAVQKVVEKVSREVQNAIKQTQTNYS